MTAKLVGRQASDDCMLRMLRGRIRQNREAGDFTEQLVRCVITSKFGDPLANTVRVALEKPLVVHVFADRGPRTAGRYFLVLFFFTGGLVIFVTFFVSVTVEVPPSASDRLSSISTVWVIAVSVPTAAGCAVAGAIVCVVSTPVLFARWRLQPARNATAKSSGMTVFLT